MTYDPRQWYSYSKTYNEPAPVAVEKSSPEVVYVPSPIIKSPPGAPASRLHTPHAGQIDLTGSPVEKDPEKLQRYISKLQEFVSPLPTQYKKRLPYDVLCQLAHALLDGTVFEITGGLKDIQKLSEKNLDSKRKKLAMDQRGRTVEMRRRHQAELNVTASRPHQLALIEKQHAEERAMFQQTSERDLLQLDQKCVLELDQIVTDQQVALQRAGVPLFSISNKPEDVRLQMYLLEFIAKLNRIFCNRVTPILKS